MIPEEISSLVNNDWTVEIELMRATGAPVKIQSLFGWAFEKPLFLKGLIVVDLIVVWLVNFFLELRYLIPCENVPDFYLVKRMLNFKFWF